MVFGVFKGLVRREWWREFVTVDLLPVPVDIDVKPILGDVVGRLSASFGVMVVPNDGRPFVRVRIDEILELDDEPPYFAPFDINAEPPPSSVVSASGVLLCRNLGDCRRSCIGMAVASTGVLGRLLRRCLCYAEPDE